MEVGARCYEEFGGTNSAIHLVTVFNGANNIWPVTLCGNFSGSIKITTSLKAATQLILKLKT